MKRSSSPPPPRMPTSKAPPTPKHPGTIEMHNADDGSVQEQDAKAVPSAVAFVDGVPVVKIVTRALDDGGREAVSYDAGGNVLRAQVFIKSP